MTMTGTEKSAILMMTLGEDRAAEVFKHLSPREVQQISARDGEYPSDFQQAAGRGAELNSRTKPSSMRR